METAIYDKLIKTLANRFAKNMHRHTGIDWPLVQAKLDASPEKLQVLHAMDRTGGPAGRRSICYNHNAPDARKKNKM